MEFSAFPSYLESPARQLFRRCVQCPNTTPSCPQCADDEECSFDLGGCNACPSNKCIKNPGSSSSSSTSSPAGPIAGGVIGGIVLVSILVALVYFFYIKKKRQQSWVTQLDDLRSVGEQSPGLGAEKSTSQPQSFIEHRSNRQSTQSVATMKTSASRQSNVIQIAYIPGVTSTAAASPEMVPPVPPIPAAGTTSPHLNTGTEQFFMINDLRPESTYTTDYAGSDRKSYARSVARSSIAASEYQHDAIVNPMPARAAVAARAVPISVKSASRMASPTGSPHLSHQNSVAGEMTRPMTGQSVQAKQVTITKGGANTQRSFVHEMEDTSPAPTPRIGLERSGTASPRSMLSDDDARSGPRQRGGRSPGSPQPPVSAVRSEFSQSRTSPVSNYGWENNTHNIRNTIRDAALLAYGQNGHQQTSLQEIAELDGDTASLSNDPKSPFADTHATRTP